MPVINLKIVITALLLAVIFYACQQKSKVEQRKEEVMAVHDEVMPKMGTLMDLKNQLEDRIAHLDSTGKSTEKLNRLVQQLEEADESMMQWMRNYQDPSDRMSEEEALEYLVKKMESIKKVKQKINTSKASAEAALDK